MQPQESIPGDLEDPTLHCKSQSKKGMLLQLCLKSPLVPESLTSDKNGKMPSKDSAPWAIQTYYPKKRWH